ncbi:hypothetical protein ESA94_15245 [Lacibacter luteus]|uniref:Glycosyltransferase RgtA/B/C/D-like domain-containing protein n=1 Tax=Lacibacter luteus TaxID=2508719 RepID=A0A4Q1CFG7_9BACT|nr:hypothetical protein [Lacibacter luteus]RXK58744.1 hypothetical protein ESA94_15245 [Lacibacter luteus]
MTYFLFAIYLVLFSWLVTRIKFIRESGLSNQWIIGLFLLKVAAGVAYGYFFTTIPNYERSADSWKFFFDAKQDTKILFQNPVRYLLSIFDNPYDREYRHLFSSVNSYWNDLKHTYMVKIVSLFNVFTGSRYYVNVIFYSFVTFFGPIAFIRVMNDVFPGKKLLITCSTFLFPSFLFWSSGIHKDGLVFTFLSLIVFVMYFGLKNKKMGLRNIAIILLLLLAIFPVRNHVVLACVPGLVAWWAAEKFFTKQKWISFALVTIIGTTVFFSAKYVHPKLDLPVSIALRNKEFIKLGGNSFLPQRKLHATFSSFMQNAPQALNHALVRPYITEFQSPLYIICAIEILFIWLLVSVWFFRYNSNPYKHSVVMFLFLVSMVLLLLTGYIVPQLGGIVRYRAIFFPFILVPIITTIDWRKNKLE